MHEKKMGKQLPDSVTHLCAHTHFITSTSRKCPFLIFLKFSNLVAFFNVCNVF